MMWTESLSRRSFLSFSAGLAAWAGGLRPERFQQEMLRRTIPDEDEEIPVIGLSAWGSFDVGPTEAERAPLREVLRRFYQLGGRVIDTSPMYAHSETVVGDLLAELELSNTVFMSTKVWTSGEVEGKYQMETSLEKLKMASVDLMSVHNMLDADTHLETLEDYQDRDLVRYRGISHYTVAGYPAVERHLDEDDVEFVQINYNIAERDAELRIIPEAEDEEIGVIVNRPFAGGALLDKVRGKPLPEWASEFDCKSWPQFFLKFIIAHPDVTCVIPGTSNPDHLVDNMAAGTGRLPDAAMRRRMAAYIDGL